MVSVPRAIRRDIGQLLIGSLPGTTITPELRSLAREFALGGVILFARNIEAPEQVAELSHDVQALATELPLWVSVDQEGGRVARLKAPFTEWPPMATLGRSGDEALARAVRRGAGRRAAGRRHHARLRAGARHPHQPEEPGHRRPRAGRGRGQRRAARRGDHPRRCRTTASPPAASTFPGTATRRSTRISSCRSSSIRRIGSGASSSCRSAPRSRAGVAFIMTAHVLVPSLDEEQPATLSPTIVQGMLREELGFDGVILSDDLEMKAIAKTYAVPEAAVQAIAAGCDGLLICSGDVDVQAATLEALVHAVEQDGFPTSGSRTR